jgi:hypothetical protein
MNKGREGGEERTGGESGDDDDDEAGKDSDLAEGSSRQRENRFRMQT